MAIKLHQAAEQEGFFFLFGAALTSANPSEPCDAQVSDRLSLSASPALPAWAATGTSSRL